MYKDKMGIRGLIWVMLVSIIIFHVSPDQGESLPDQKEELVSIVQNCLKEARKYCREELQRHHKYKSLCRERYPFCVEDKSEECIKKHCMKCQSSYFKTKLYVNCDHFFMLQLPNNYMAKLNI